MLKKTSGILALVMLGALSLSLMNCGSSSSRPAGLLYVLSEEEENVSSFSLDLSSGNLSLINSNATTCTTLPTASCGGPLQISLDPTGATAFVLNQGVFNSGQSQNPPVAPSGIVPSIYGYNVNSDGSLSPPSDVTSNPSPPVLSPCNAAAQGVFTPCDIPVAMTRDASGAFLFVVTQGNQSLPGLIGQLPALPPMLYVLGTKPGSTSVMLESSLTLTRVPTSLSAITYTPQGSSSAQTLLFMTSNQDLSQYHNDNELSVYSVDSSGNLIEAPNSPYTTEVDPTVVQAVNTSPAGAPTAGDIFVFVGNSTSSAGGVSAFELCTQVNPPSCQQSDVNNYLLFSVGTPTNVGQNPVAMLVDPTNSFLYIACNGSNQVYAFSIGTTSGKLTALSPAYQPTGTQPFALAMHGGLNSNSEFLYVSNLASNNITGWPVVATTGTLGTPPINVIFTPGQPSGMAVR